MSTFFATIQFVGYGIGIVSAALNIASLVRRWHAIEAAFDRDELGSWP
jgi:hypothetical protein